MIYVTDRNGAKALQLQRALLAADGYLYLAMPEEAIGELDELDQAFRSDRGVVRMRVRAMLHLKRWRTAEALASEGTELYPDENEFMVQRAFALHQMKKGLDAVQVLLAAPEWIRKTGILHYNLACYEAQLGDLSTARQCIRAAIKMNSSFKKNARQDPDLQRLWN